MDKTTLFDLTYGVYVVSTQYEGKLSGCLINTAMQVTSEPAQIEICVNKNNFTHDEILKSKKFGISILNEKTPQTLIGLFGFKTSKEINKFESVQHKIIADIPVLTESAGFLVCDLVTSLALETHTLFIGKLVEAERFEKDPVMTYAYYHNVIKGKSPKAAPTYQAPEKASGKKYICDICGYEYDGNQLPDDFKCPVCGVDRSHFKTEQQS